MSFKPRLTASGLTSSYYTTQNPYYPYFKSTPAWYAWGRFYEILGTKPSLCVGTPGKWYGYTKDKYSRGQKPKLGAVACWSTTKKNGVSKVAIVEKIAEDGAVTFSEYSGSFSTYTRRGKNYGSSKDYVFQGFIYNPINEIISASDPLYKFLNCAESLVGRGYDCTDITPGLPWCAAFVAKCARVAGVSDKIIVYSWGATTTTRQSVANGWGTWYDGPIVGKKVVPNPGDLILIKWDEVRDTSSRFSSDHIGIVLGVANNKVYTIEGNRGGDGSYRNKVKRCEYSINNKVINGYYRPNWTKVGSPYVGTYIAKDGSRFKIGSKDGLKLSGGDVLNNSGTGASNVGPVMIAPLYEELNDRKDAIIREVGYANSKGEPSISTSDIRVSIVNYTTLLSSYYDAVAESLGGVIPGTSDGGNGNYNGNYNGDYNTTETSLVPYQIVKFFKDKGLSAAFGIGICGNVKRECSFHIGAATTDTNGLTSGGIVQWNGPNYTNMVEHVGSGWKTDLTGQLNYLWWDMNNRAKSWLRYMVKRYYGISKDMVDYMREQPDTLAGAKKCADIFCKCYENGAQPKLQSQIAQRNVAELWPSLSKVTTSAGGGNKT